MENYLIYRILNLKTRKFYIGRTTMTIKKRWFVHISHARYGEEYSKKQNKKIGQSYLYNSIRKYGIENFEIKQIDEAKNYNHMVFLENFYIKYYNSLDPRYGYNLVTNKYDSGEIRDCSEEYKKKTSIRTHIMYNVPSGVSYDKHRNKYKLYMRYMGKTLINKRFETEQEAKITHDKIDLFFYKENAILYFPDKKQEFLSEDLENFYAKINEKKHFFSKYKGISINQEGWFHIRIANQRKSRISIGFEKEEKSAAIIWDKVAYFLGYKKEELNIPELWNENYKKEGEEIFNIYSNPNRQRQIKNGKTSKYNGVNKCNCKWEMAIKFKAFKAREYYTSELDAARAHDYFRRKLNIGLNKLNFPNENIIEKPIDIKTAKLLKNNKQSI